MANPFDSPAILSFCPGILGLERGLVRAIGRVRTIAYVEIEAFAVENLIVGMETGALEPAPVWTNIKTFDARPFRGLVDGILAGYPCQPFSVIGIQTGEEHESHLWPSVRAAEQASRPVWVLLENVVNHLNIGYQQVKRELEEDGYRVKEGIYSAVEVGAPHRRERLFILAIRMDYCGRQRLEGYARHVERPAGQDSGGRGQAGSVGTSGISHSLFPARPNEEQFEWEESRVLESRVGITTDGYNFYRDLLHALGNSVVEQTAELAFRDLLRKHFE